MKSTDAPLNISVLVVVTYGKKARFQIGIFQRSPRNGADQRVLLGSDILIFIDKYPAIPIQQTVTLRLGVGFRVVSQFELSFFLYGPRFLGAGAFASIRPTTQAVFHRSQRARF
ncbi:hypothetical protein ASD8599_03459 [Ascidiaceihabitans donghaensis]|uniref:Uncharacterized protein n=1 Tax=Ascidiaceihabitans donghaensis TaxID=1510460 RepID=A0A2R8BHW2_9RHOB|nr:hypothetical protein ASD8599_03459 [Ascidiaceihabitans donghaensis]